ncbi:hypothetical protein EV122DRAFT_282381 [Schizophyllum commune]
MPPYDGSDARPCILQWAAHELNAPVCFPPTCYGPDAGTCMQIVGGKNDGALFTAFFQFKYRNSNLSDDEARNAIMSITPAHLGDTMLKTARGKIQDAQAEVDSLRAHLKDGFKSIKGGTPSEDLFGEYHVLRVVASPSDLRLERLDKETLTPRFQEELDDPHPIATLNTEFVDSILKDYRPIYEFTNRKEGEDVIDEDDDDDQPPAIASNSGAVDDQATENGDGATGLDDEDTAQIDDSDMVSAASAGNDELSEIGDKDAMEDVSESAIPAASGAGGGDRGGASVEEISICCHYSGFTFRGSTYYGYSQPDPHAAGCSKFRNSTFHSLGTESDCDGTSKKADDYHWQTIQVSEVDEMRNWHDWNC